MAIVISAATIKELSTVQKDVFNQGLVKRVALNGAISDADTAAILTAVEGLSNAYFSKAEILTRRPATGLGVAAVSALQNLISACVELAFLATQSDGGTATRTFLIPAFKENLLSEDGSVDIVTNANMGTLISLLEDNLVWKDSDNTLQVGGMTYSAKRSAAITLSDIVQTPA